MNEQLRTLGVMERLRMGYEGRKNELKSWWQGEEIIKGMASDLQKRVEFESKHLPETRKNITQSLQLYGKLFLNNSDKVPDQAIFNIYKIFKKQYSDNSMDELNIETKQFNSQNFRKEAMSYIEKKIEQSVLSYLFATARESATTPFDHDKEYRQMRAVYHMLSGDHVAMDTGDGKTSVVIPIFTVAKSLLSEARVGVPSVFLSGADDATTAEMREKTLRYSKKVAVAINNIDTKTKEILSRRISLSPLPPNYDSSSDADSYALKQLTAKAPSYDWGSNTGANIGFMDHSDVVFQTTGKYIDKVDESAQLIRPDIGLPEAQMVYGPINQRFEHVLPTFIIDEAHLLRNPYITENGRITQEMITLDLKQEKVRNDLCEYLILRLFHNEVAKDKKRYVKRIGGTATLTDEGYAQVSKMVRRWRREIVEYGGGEGQETETIKAIRTIINEEIKPNFDIIGKSFSKNLIGFFGDYVNTRRHTDKDFFSEKKAQEALGMDNKEMDKTFVDQNVRYVIEGYLEAIGSLEEGVDYLTPDKLLDHFRGIRLQSHRFTSDVDFFLNTEGKRPYIADEKNIGYHVNFYTWLSLINRGNIIALSNDLYYTDPTTGERVLSTFGKALEKHTNGRVVDLAAKKSVSERLPIPHPIVEKDSANLIDNLSKSILDSKRSEMVVYWDEGKAKELFESLRGQGKKVALIDSSVDNRDADRYQNQFENYEIDVLITTGRKSFATDFKDRKGQFTDFRVSVVDPETIFQIGQAYGRRRLPKNEKDFSLFFTKEKLMILGSSVLKQKHNVVFEDIFPWLGRADPMFSELKELLDKDNLSDKEQKKLNDITIKVLRRSQEQVDKAWEQTIENEVAFIQGVAPRVKEKKASIFREEFNSSQSQIKKVIKKQVDMAVQRYHLSESIADKLTQKAEAIAYQSFTQIDESLVEDYFQDTLMTAYNSVTATTHPKYLQAMAMRRFDERLQSEYGQIWQDLLQPDSFYLNQVLGGQLQEELRLFGEILTGLPGMLRRRHTNSKKVKDFYFLFSPYYEKKTDVLYPREMDMEIFPTAHGSKMGIRIGDNQQPEYFLLSDTGNSWNMIDKDLFERRLAVLNNLPQSYFKGKKFADVHWPGKEKTTKFLRVELT